MPRWGTVLKQMQAQSDDPGGDSAADKVRRQYLMELNKHVGRNVICYYSGFLSKPQNMQGLEINDDDKNGFMECVEGLDKKLGLDLFIHTPGGDGEATRSLVHYLKEMFGKDIRAFVPQIAMSAGTIIACACKSIVMGKQSNIGPVDPQVNGIPAYAVLAEVERAYKEITADNQRSWVWNPILANYTPGFLQRCHWAKQNAKEMVSGFLKDNMLSHLSETERDRNARIIFKILTDSSIDKGHNLHLHYKECEDMGLTIERLENPKDKKLQDLVLTVHHCYMFATSNTPVFKIIENHTGRRWLKVQVQMQTVQVLGQPNIAKAPTTPGSFSPGGPT